MPCFRCGTRQTDPARGASPWKRGVRAGAQVLVCPDCQRGRDWMADLDRCAGCGSTMLVRALGETVCRACGLVRSEAPEVGSEVGSEIGSDDAPAAPGGVDPGFADEVAAALARVLKSSLR